MAGELERGAGLIDNAKGRNPNQAGWLQLVPVLLYLERGEYAEALRRARRFRTPALAWGPLLCAATAALAGEDGFAASSYREFADLFPEVEVDPGEYMKAFVHSEDHFQTLLGGLERARNRATR